MSSTEKVTIECSGQCGCAVTLRKSKVRNARYYLCNSKDHGHLCEAKLPPLPPGMVRPLEINAASCFWRYTDEWADHETAAAVWLARRYLAIAICQEAIKKANPTDDLYRTLA